MPLPSTMKTKMLRWALTLAYAAGIFYLSSRPWYGVPHIPYLDKAVHLGLYMGLGFLCAWALEATTSQRGPKVILAATMMVACYGATDEFHQLFVPGRSAEFLDLLSDAIGGGLGAWLSAVVRGHSRIVRGGCAAADEGGGL
jgi:VanZ like family